MRVELHAQCGDQGTVLRVDRADAVELRIVVRDLLEPLPRDVAAARHVLEERDHVVHPLRPAERDDDDGVERHQSCPATGCDPVELLERGDLVARQLDLLRSNRVFDVADLGRADDRRRHAGPPEHPGKRHLSSRDATFGGDLLHAVDDLEVELGVVERVAERVAAGTRGQSFALTGAGAGEQSARERAPWQHRDALVDALRDHLALLFAVDEVVVVLHRDEPGRAGALGGRLRLRELPREHAARADVAGLAGLDDVVESLHRLGDRRQRIPAVDLVEVDVVQPEPCQRGVDRGHDVLA